MIELSHYLFVALCVFMGYGGGSSGGNGSGGGGGGYGGVCVYRWPCKMFTNLSGTVQVIAKLMLAIV